MCKGGVNMIQGVKFNSNVNFKGSEEASNEKKNSLKEAYSKARELTVDTVKGFNSVSSTSYGVLRGAVGGTILGGLVGLIGKNVKNSQGKIAPCVSGILKDLSSGALKAVKTIPSLFTKAPVENIKTALKLPSKFFNSYLKGNKLTAAFSAATLGSILAFRTIQGRMNGNLKNANVDHKLNQGHTTNN